MDLELAELTPAGRGAVSVVRLRGKDAEAFVQRLCGGAPIESGAPRLARLRLDGEELDEALVCRTPGGDFELHLHGSPAVVERIASLVPSRRPGVAREDLEALAAEALEKAPAEAAARILLDQAEGALARELRALPASADPSRRIDALLARWRTARFALRPPEVVLAGPVNAGKSTLFNALLGENRAIVDPAPGTTRDVLRERALLGAWPVFLVDTAGERDPEGADEVEREGQARARGARAAADLVLWLRPVDSTDPPPSAGARSEIVRTFADRSSDPEVRRGAISALRDPAGARARIAELYRRVFALPEDPWSPGQAVPFTESLAAAIADLRGRSGSDLERGVDEIVAPRSAPP